MPRKFSYFFSSTYAKMYCASGLYPIVAKCADAYINRFDMYEDG